MRRMRRVRRAQDGGCVMELAILSGPVGVAVRTPNAVTIGVADDAEIQAYRLIRAEVFVEEQGLFQGHDGDEVDDDPRTVVLVARDADGVVGGVRIAPVLADDLGWWTGSRLVVRRGARGAAGIGGSLIRAACAEAESRGVLRFEATVQLQNEVLFRRLGWEFLGRTEVVGLQHARMRWPIDRFDRAARATKERLGAILSPLLDSGGLGGAGFVGDDGAPVPGSELVAACDAIVPSMVERHPEWAGWCSVLVNVNDLTAMGANPVALLDAIGARDASFASRIVRGMRDAAQAWGVPVIGGHTQLGVPAALSVTALGHAPVPIRGAAPVGHELTLTADHHGGWRPGFVGAQWDSTSTREPAVLRELAVTVRRAAPTAAKDVSMAGLLGTIGMMAEASGSGAVVEVASVPSPSGAALADWFACFPGFAMVTADAPGSSRMRSDHAVSAPIGRLVAGAGVALRWPDGEETTAVRGSVTGLGAAGARASE